MVPSSTSTHVEAPASEGRQSSACQTLASEALASEAPASKECYFFRIPPEIRLQIYRYLFEPRCALESTTSWDNRKMYLKNYGCYEDSDNEPMYPAILQTSRAIYAEAAPQLYARTTIDMEICDVVDLSERETIHDTKKRRAEIWRHHPLRGMGYRDAKGLQVYASDEMSGDIEPHVFAKFERLHFHADFDFENAEIQPPVKIDKDHRFVAEHEIRFGANLRRSDVIWNFVSLLSNSPFINRLVVHVGFSLTPKFEFRPPPLTVEEDESEFQEYSKTRDVIEGRAWEIFLDNNMLAPLGTLDNVKSIELGPIVPPSKPQQHHVKMVQDLKEKIERNWQLSQAAKNSTRALQPASP